MLLRIGDLGDLCNRKYSAAAVRVQGVPGCLAHPVGRFMGRFLFYGVVED